MPTYEFLEKIKDGSLDVIEWLASQDEETIRERVYECVTELDLDISVGSYEYDAIEPTIQEIAVAYFMLQQIILLAFPQHSSKEWLTLAAEARGVYRKQATYASGFLEILGVAGTVIPSGTKFTNVISIGSNLPIKYYTTLDTVTIGEDGSCEVQVSADEVGIAGNVKAEEICLNISDLPNITRIHNKEAFTNGSKEESDKSLLERLLDRVRHPIGSGNKNDYRQWAKEVAGVAEAEVVPLWNGPGTVQVIILGAGGIPIPDIVPKVKEYLDPSDQEGEGEGKAPIGAVVTVITTDNYAIRIDIYGLEYQNGYQLDSTKAPIIKALKERMAEVSMGGFVRIHDIEDTIRHVVGVRDFEEVLLNGNHSNIQIPIHLKPSVWEVLFDGI